MIKNILICLCFGFLAACVQDQNGTAQATDQRITIGERFSMASEVLGEDRSYWVYLPPSYDSDTTTPKSYPVMYLLDGDAHFHSASGVITHMSTGINGNNQIPELIVIAIPNTNRTRDLTPTHSSIGFDGEETEFLDESGGGDAFLQFIRDELFPNIDSTYRTTKHRTLVGHSFGGLLALHALLTVPDMFESYIAIDPSLWWEDRLLVRQAENIFANEHNRNASVYISLANNPDAETGERSAMELSGREFGKILASAVSPDIRFSLQYFETENHGSVPLVSLYYGLLSIFDGYEYSVADFIANPSIPDVIAHFDSISKRLGIDPRPPEGSINTLGYVLLYQIVDVDNAVEMFELNVLNYPDSWNVYDSLGEAYMVRGDKELAIENYERSVELNPDNENGVTQLEILNGEEEVPQQ